MELIYSMRRKPLKCEPPHFESATDPEVVRPIVTISTCNIIAFSSPTELSDTDGDTWGGHVYVCDLDTPWDSHKVTSTTYPVSALEWNSEGTQLLVATTVGDAAVYGQKDFLLNEWTCLYSANFPGEHIIKAALFHNGRRAASADKKPDAPIAERLRARAATPTLKGFGGVACPGACVVTASGLVGILTPPPPAAAPPAPPAALTAVDTLRAVRDRVTYASFAHKNGNLLIAALCAEGGRGVVRGALVCVVRPPAPPPAARPARLCLQPLPSVCLPDSSLPVSLTWCGREDADALLVAGATLSMWELTERAYPVHKLLHHGALQGSTTPGGGQKPASEFFNTVVWQQVGVWAGESGAVVVAHSRNAAAPVAVLCAKRALRVLHAAPGRDPHHAIWSRPVMVPCGPQETTAGSPPKKTKYGSGVSPSGGGAVVSSVEISHLGGVAVLLDTRAQLHVYRLPPPWADIPTPVSVQQAAHALELALVCGHDCLDALLTLKPSRAEAVYERLTESFQRQPQAFQQYYYHSWLKLRIALCRMVGSLQAAASWLTCVQSLGALWGAARAATRPAERPDAPLHALLAADHADHADTDKALVALEAKNEAIVEAAALQALRRPLQRVVDIAMSVLASVPHHQQHGYELWTDPAAVALLRKLLCVARGAGVGGGDAAPGRLLARLTLAPAKPELLEECAAVAAAAGAGRVWEALPRCSVSAPHQRPLPLLLEYGVEPEQLRYAPEPPACLQSDMSPAPAMDSIRYMFVGGGQRARRLRACGRCGARALPHVRAPRAPGAPRAPLQRAYDARFLPACRCGGKWTLVSNIT